MIYLASPYSDSSDRVMHQRYTSAIRCTAILMEHGLPVYSPIVHCHVITGAYKMPRDAKFWEAYNTSFIRKADAVYVLKIDGWDTSVGVTMEIELARQLGIPIQYVDVDGVRVYA